MKLGKNRLLTLRMPQIGPLLAFIIVNYTGDVDSRWAYRIVLCTQYGFAGVSAVLVAFLPEYVSALASITNGRPG